MNILKERINALENINKEITNEKDNIAQELSILSKESKSVKAKLD